VYNSVNLPTKLYPLNVIWFVAVLPKVATNCCHIYASLWSRAGPPGAGRLFIQSICVLIEKKVCVREIQCENCGAVNGGLSRRPHPPSAQPGGPGLRERCVKNKQGETSSEKTTAQVFHSPEKAPFCSRCGWDLHGGSVQESRDTSFLTRRQDKGPGRSHSPTH